MDVSPFLTSPKCNNHQIVAFRKTLEKAHELQREITMQKRKKTVKLYIRSTDASSRYLYHLSASHLHRKSFISRSHLLAGGKPGALPDGYASVLTFQLPTPKGNGLRMPALKLTSASSRRSLLSSETALKTAFHMGT